MFKITSIYDKLSLLRPKYFSVSWRSNYIYSKKVRFVCLFVLFYGVLVVYILFFFLNIWNTSLWQIKQLLCKIIGSKSIYTRFIQFSLKLFKIQFEIVFSWLENSILNLKFIYNILFLKSMMWVLDQYYKILFVNKEMLWTFLKAPLI